VADLEKLQYALEILKQQGFRVGALTVAAGEGFVANVGGKMLTSHQILALAGLEEGGQGSRIPSLSNKPIN